MFGMFCCISAFYADIYLSPKLMIITTLMQFSNITHNKLKYWDTKKIINFPFVPNGKLIIFRCPNIEPHFSLIVMCLNIGTPNNHHFPLWTNGKEVVLGVPILKHFRVHTY